MTSKAIKVPANLHAGRYVFDVRSGDQRGHSLQLFKLRSGYTWTQFKHDLVPGIEQANDPAATRRIYNGVAFFGGIVAGRSFSETLYAGKYYLLDVEGSIASHAVVHVSGTPGYQRWLGDGSVLRVTQHRHFRANETIPAKGWTVFRNNDTEPHFVEMLRVKQSTTRAQVKQALTGQAPPDWVLGQGPSLNVISPGSQMLFRHDLKAGKYLVMCFMPDPAHGDMPHALMGMYDFVYVK
jgi:hypothetical protein